MLTTEHHGVYLLMCAVAGVFEPPSSPGFEWDSMWGESASGSCIHWCVPEINMSTPLHPFATTQLAVSKAPNQKKQSFQKTRVWAAN